MEFIKPLFLIALIFYWGIHSSFGVQNEYFITKQELSQLKELKQKNPDEIKVLTSLNNYYAQIYYGYSKDDRNAIATRICSNSDLKKFLSSYVNCSRILNQWNELKKPLFGEKSGRSNKKSISIQDVSKKNIAQFYLVAYQHYCSSLEKGSLTEKEKARCEALRPGKTQKPINIKKYKEDLEDEFRDTKAAQLLGLEPNSSTLNTHAKYYQAISECTEKSDCLTEIKTQFEKTLPDKLVKNIQGSKNTPMLNKKGNLKAKDQIGSRLSEKLFESGINELKSKYAHLSTDSADNKDKVSRAIQLQEAQIDLRLKHLENLAEASKKRHKFSSALDDTKLQIDLLNRMLKRTESAKLSDLNDFRISEHIDLLDNYQRRQLILSAASSPSSHKIDPKKLQSLIDFINDRKGPFATKTANYLQHLVQKKQPILRDQLSFLLEPLFQKEFDKAADYLDQLRQALQNEEKSDNKNEIETNLTQFNDGLNPLTFLDCDENKSTFAKDIESLSTIFNKAQFSETNQIHLYKRAFGILITLKFIHCPNFFSKLPNLHPPINDQFLFVSDTVKLENKRIINQFSQDVVQRKQYTVIKGFTPFYQHVEDYIPTTLNREHLEKCWEFTQKFKGNLSNKILELNKSDMPKLFYPKSENTDFTYLASDSKEIQQSDGMALAYLWFNGQSTLAPLNGVMNSNLMKFNKIFDAEPIRSAVTDIEKGLLKMYAWISVIGVSVDNHQTTITPAVAEITVDCSSNKTCQELKTVIYPLSKKHAPEARKLLGL